MYPERTGHKSHMGKSYGWSGSIENVKNMGKTLFFLFTGD
jgi:hypothetical protein